MKRDALNKHGICLTTHTKWNTTKKKEFLLLKYYMQITITINSIPKKKIKKREKRCQTRGQ